MHDAPASPRVTASNLHEPASDLSDRASYKFSVDQNVDSPFLAGLGGTPHVLVSPDLDVVLAFVHEIAVRRIVVFDRDALVVRNAPLDRLGCRIIFVFHWYVHSGVEALRSTLDVSSADAMLVVRLLFRDHIEAFLTAARNSPAQLTDRLAFRVFVNSMSQLGF